MRIQKALILAETIARLPPEEISLAIDEMRRERKLSATVHILNMLLEHPEHRPVAVAALENLGMWAPGRSRHQKQVMRQRPGAPLPPASKAVSIATPSNRHNQAAAYLPMFGRTAFAALVLWAGTEAAAEDRVTVVRKSNQRAIIENDYGGLYAEYIERIWLMGSLELRGNCFSACTVYLANPDTCVHPDAVLGFHAGYDIDPAIKARPNRKQELLSWDAYVLSLYPEKVRNWISRNGGLTAQPIYLQGHELREAVRICGSTNNDLILLHPLGEPQ